MNVQHGTTIVGLTTKMKQGNDGCMQP